MKFNTAFSACVLGSMLLFSGCASIVSGTSNNFEFKSDPNSAKVVITDK